jgi:glycosyltransferase involved in cell wall biosynthesis
MRLCLNMIVRNEAAVIERCLASVRDRIHAWAIVDTGSTDGTQDRIRAFLHDIPGTLAEHEWVDFATNRNQALVLARELGDYALFVDADDFLSFDEGFSFEGLTGPAYTVETEVAGVVSMVETLVRLDLDWKWQGVLHETLQAGEPVVWQALSGVRLCKPGGGARGREGVREKYARDARVLREALRHEPGNVRYRFYLAHSLRESGDYAAALAAYADFIEAKTGSAEETYFARLMLPLLGERCGWDDERVLAAYRSAYEFRPQRAETMSRLARYHLRRNRFAQARECARLALATPPTTDTLLVDRGAWTWKPLDDMAGAALGQGDVAAAREAYKRLLADVSAPAAERERVRHHLERLERTPQT